MPFGFHVERPEPAPQFVGLFQSEADLEADLWLNAHAVDDDDEADIGGEA